MSLDEYMDGWRAGVMFAHLDPASDDSHVSADVRCGYAAGRAAYESARREEEARARRCEVCGGDGVGPDNPHGPNWPQTFEEFRRTRPTCGAVTGTGRKPAPAGEE
jgi:hypothetical protein